MGGVEWEGGVKERWNGMEGAEGKGEWGERERVKGKVGGMEWKRARGRGRALIQQEY